MEPQAYAAKFNCVTVVGYIFFCIVLFLWPPCVADADIIFLPYVVSSIFLLFSSPNLSGRRVDVYHTSTHGVALVRI